MSEPQHMTALARATEVRLARATAKERIRKGSLSIADALSMECCQSMTIFKLLCSQNGWGRDYLSKGSRALALLSSEQISPYRQVRQLTDRQRGVIAAACDMESVAA